MGTVETPGAGPDPLLRADRAPTPRTLVDILRATADDHPDSPAIDNGREVLTYDELLASAADVVDRPARRGRRARATGSACASRRARPTSTSPSSASCSPARPTCPSTHDDPDERARLVFNEAGVAAVVTADLVILSTEDAAEPAPEEDPDLTDDAWVIFTSGSTGTPKGVAVSHRSAAAFVDAEARMFLQDEPIGPGDRVMAGLSVAFDASCEEMWLAWRYGACLVPAPRSLVKSRHGPRARGCVANDITVVSTVPTLVALWPAAALDDVRLLILGGEACPPELGARLATRRAARSGTPTAPPRPPSSPAVPGSTGEPPVRIGLPLDGWDLAVVDAAGPAGSPDGEPGELIIGGVGLARYLDPAKDAETSTPPMPTLGWDRAYRSGDIVRFDGEGLVFNGRADDQVKVGGRRIELGEVDSALLSLPGRERGGGGRPPQRGGQQPARRLRHDRARLRRQGRRRAAARARCRPPSCRGSRSSTPCPTRTSGKIDRDALPWPPPARPGATASDAAPGRRGHGGLGRGPLDRHPRWRPVRPRRRLLRPRRRQPDRGPAREPAARALPRGHRRRRLRPPGPRRARRGPRRHGDPDRPAERRRPPGAGRRPRSPRCSPRSASARIGAPALAHLGRRRQPCVGRGVFDLDWLPDVGWGWVLLGWLLLVNPLGRIAAGRRRRPGRAPSASRPGTHPRGGSVHLRLWLAERLVDELGATGLSSAPLVKVYARLLGCRSAGTSTCTASPRSPGCSPWAAAARSSPRSTSPGTGSTAAHLHIGAVRVGADARVGARSTLLPGADVGDGRRGRGRLRGRSVTVPDGRGLVGRPGPVLRHGPAARGATTARRTGRPGWPPTPARRSCSRCCPILAVLAGLAVAAPALAASRRHPGCRGARRVLWLPLVDRGRRRRARPAGARRGAAARAGARGRSPPGARPPGVAGVVDRCGCSTRPAPGSSRSTPRG